MLTQEDRIPLIHANRTALLDHIFDELSRKLPGLSAEQVADNIVATAKRIQNALLNSDQIDNAAPGLFILAL